MHAEAHRARTWPGSSPRTQQGPAWLQGRIVGGPGGYQNPASRDLRRLVRLENLRYLLSFNMDTVASILIQKSHRSRRPLSEQQVR
jgi:hypothetical protein